MSDDPSIDALPPRKTEIPTPRSPLIIGGIALGLLAWMVLVVFALIAWRLLGG